MIVRCQTCITCKSHDTTMQSHDEYLQALFKSEMKLSVMTLHSSSSPVPSTPIRNPQREAAEGSKKSPLLSWNTPVVSTRRSTKHDPLSWENLWGGGSPAHISVYHLYTRPLCLPYLLHMICIRSYSDDVAIVSNTIHIRPHRQAYILRACII